MPRGGAEIPQHGNRTSASATAATTGKPPMEGVCACLKLAQTRTHQPEGFRIQNQHDASTTGKCTPLPRSKCVTTTYPPQTFGMSSKTPGVAVHPVRHFWIIPPSMPEQRRWRRLACLSTPPGCHPPPSPTELCPPPCWTNGTTTRRARSALRTPSRFARRPARSTDGHHVQRSVRRWQLSRNLKKCADEIATL